MFISSCGSHFGDQKHLTKDLQRSSHLYQLVIAGLAADFSPLKTLDAHPNNLPIQPTPLIGRQKEVAMVGELLHRQNVRLVTLTGPGGTGKTRLGLQVAAQQSEVFPDGVFFVDLAPIRDPEFVIPAIAQTLDVKEMRGRSLRASDGKSQSSGLVTSRVAAPGRDPNYEEIYCI